MLTYEQATNPAIREFWHVTMKNADGTPVRARRNGVTQTWKTRPGEFSMPVKRGIYEAFRITQLTREYWAVPALWPVESELFRGVTT